MLGFGHDFVLDVEKFFGADGGLGKEVGKLFFGVDVLDVGYSLLMELANEVVIRGDVFASKVGNFFSKDGFDC
mgnify:CR=1 FL=1